MAKKLQGRSPCQTLLILIRRGNALQLMDVVGVDDTMLEDLHDRDNALRLRGLVQKCLTPREAEIIRLRYGLGGTVPFDPAGSGIILWHLPELCIAH